MLGEGFMNVASTRQIFCVIPTTVSFLVHVMHWTDADRLYEEEGLLDVLFLYMEVVKWFRKAAKQGSLIG